MQRSCQEITDSNRISLKSRVDHIRVPTPQLQTWAHEHITLRLSNLICSFLTTDKFPLSSLVNFCKVILVCCGCASVPGKTPFLVSLLEVTFRKPPCCHLLLRSPHISANLLLDFQSQLGYLCQFVLKTHHRPAVFHQVDSDDAEERSKTQLRAQRCQKHFEKQELRRENERGVGDSRWCQGNIRPRARCPCGWRRSDLWSAPPETEPAETRWPTGPISCDAGTELRTSETAGITTASSRSWAKSDFGGI